MSSCLHALEEKAFRQHDCLTAHLAAKCRVLCSASDSGGVQALGGGVRGCPLVGPPPWALGFGGLRLVDKSVLLGDGLGALVCEDEEEAGCTVVSFRDGTAPEGPLG